MMRTIVLTTLLAGICSLAAAQTTSVAFVADTTAFANPDRGFYHFSEARASAYVPLDSATLVGWKTNEHITLVYRGFVLNTFVTSPISTSYLAAMQQDFQTLRAAGLKCIPRFIYTDVPQAQAPYGDATKAQMLAHLQQLKPVLQANQDVICVLQAGLIGTWGEWYYTTAFGDPLAGPLTATDYANRREVVDSLLAVVPERMVAIRTPGYKLNMLGFTLSDTLTAAQAWSGSEAARLAFHNDCFLSSANDVGTFNTAAEHDYLTAETRYVSYGGETCADNAFNDCAAAVPVMQQDHLSYLHIDYVPTVITKWQTQGCFADIDKKMGYRFVPVDVQHTTSCGMGETFALQLRVVNEGWATPFNVRNFSLLIRNTATNQVFRVLDPVVDCRRWWSGDTTVISITAGIGSTVVAGTYDVLIQLAEPFASISANPDYTIRMAGVGVWEPQTGWNHLSQFTVTSTTTGPLYSGVLWLGSPIYTGVAVVQAPECKAFFDGTAVQVSSTEAITAVTVTDVMGRVVAGQFVRSSSGQVQWLPAASFAGIAVLQVHTASGKAAARVLIPQR